LQEHENTVELVPTYSKEIKGLQVMSVGYRDELRKGKTPGNYKRSLRKKKNNKRKCPDTAGYRNDTIIQCMYRSNTPSFVPKTNLCVYFTYPVASVEKKKALFILII